MIVLSKNHGMTMTLVEFYDLIVGQEAAEDFTEENIDHIKKLSKCVLLYIRKKLPSMGGIDINNEKSIQAMQLSEYLDIVDSRWKQGYNDC